MTQRFSGLYVLDQRMHDIHTLMIKRKSVISFIQNTLVFLHPIIIGDPEVFNGTEITVLCQRHREPLIRPIIVLDFCPPGISAFCIFYMIQKYKGVAACHFQKIAGPWKVVGLMDGNCQLILLFLKTTFALNPGLCFLSL